MKTVITRLTVLVLTLLVAGVAFGQNGKNTDAPGGVRGEILNEIAGLEKKYKGLADAIPQEKYGWRPAEGVRSVSEVFMHVAGANFGLPGFVGAKAPDGVPKDLEKITDKKEVLENLSASFEFLRGVVIGMSDSDIEKTAKMFGRERTYREIGFFMTGHLHEHLGQLIAYARTNGVTPPWSAG